MTDKPLDLDRHRSIAAQKAAPVEAGSLLAGSRRQARHVLNSHAAGLAAHDTLHRDLVSAVLADFFDRLSNER